MERIFIKGNNPLYGDVYVSGSKNAALPILFASVIANDVCIIESIPRIKDVEVAIEILEYIGAKTEFIDKNTLKIDTRECRPQSVPVELVTKLRASYYLAGAMLARFGSVMVSLPGGCSIGSRPVDQHIKSFISLGAQASANGGYIKASALDGLKGGTVHFDVTTVGGTINAILAAVRCEGTFLIEGAAREPHVVDLANFLNLCGASISGAGTQNIKVRGVENLHGCTYQIIPDMIEAGTYMIAAAATKGNVLVHNVIPRHVETITTKLSEMGVKVEIHEDDETILISYEKELNSTTRIKTAPYPGFPTDMNPQMAVLFAIAKGDDSQIDEGIYENRFKYVDELNRFGTDIVVEDNKVAKIKGVDKLHGANVRALDLRAGAAMIIAGLAAEGETQIDDIYYIERGYEDIVEKLRALGANISKIEMIVNSL